VRWFCARVGIADSGLSWSCVSLGFALVCSCPNPERKEENSGTRRSGYIIIHELLQVSDFTKSFAPGVELTKPQIAKIRLGHTPMADWKLGWGAAVWAFDHF
jgi:hypothetical protein